MVQEGDSGIAAKMQDLALAEGALPRHLHTAMYTQSTDNRLLTNRCDDLTLLLPRVPKINIPPILFCKILKYK